ncbi:nucleotide-diphospho-sugar transferase [Hyaloraphidium curvatum]|nr:nucleotide-diphospho-sugar transferase [Hyaloraphidium curvatum]
MAGAPERVTARAHARVGLIGNPSDLYGGKGLGFAVKELFAEVTLERAESAGPLETDLFVAAWQLFSQHARDRGVDTGARPFRISSSSNVPFQSGLAGSSALLVAALRAWSAWYDLPMSRGRIAEMAWRTECEILGIRAGPLDRLVQAHEGLLAMDFGGDAFAPGKVQHLDPALLPPIVIAWHGQPGQSSGDVHAPIFERFQKGDAQIRRVMDEMASNAVAAKEALLRGDAEGFRACVDRNFDLRREIFVISDADLQLIDLGRGLGAGAKLPGSGGAVLFACRDGEHQALIAEVCRSRGCEVLLPTVACPKPKLRCIFLAAGFGTRLYPITRNKAKPLLEVGGVPMMTRMLEKVEPLGCADAVVVANGRFHEDFAAWKVTVSPSFPLHLVNDGTMTNETRLGAVKDLELGLRSAEPREDLDGYLVMACDNLFDFDLARLADRFGRTGRGQLIVRRVPAPVPPGKYSEVVLDLSDGHRVASFREKPADPRSDLSAIAVYLFPRELPELVAGFLASGANPDAPGFFVAWLSARLALEATPIEGLFMDIGSADDLARANAMFDVPKE